MYLGRGCGGLVDLRDINWCAITNTILLLLIIKEKNKYKI
jgi:hypothetical protein